MAIEITSPEASFIQFGTPNSQPFQKETNVALPEQDKWNVAFQFGIKDDATGFLPTDTQVHAAICGLDRTFKLILVAAVPLFTRTHILFDQDSINLVSIVVGATGTDYNRLVTRKELIDILYDHGIVAYDEGTYIWYKESSPAELTINYLDDANESQQLEFEKCLDQMYVDIETNMTDILAIGDCYRYGLVDSDNNVLATSNPFQRTHDNLYVALARYRNVEDAMGFCYATSEIVYNRVSLPMFIAEPQYPMSRKVYMTSKGVNKVLSSILKKEWPLTTEWMPDWMHMALATAVNHDNFELYIRDAWKSLVFAGEYKITWSEDNTDIGQATGKLEEGVFNIQNTSLGTEEPDCLPPYVKLVSVTPELATFELYPNINCKNYDFRFREKDTEGWSAPTVINIDGYGSHEFTLDLTPYPFTAFEYQFRSRCENGETSEWGYIHRFGTEACDPGFVISGGTLPDGQVGVAYSHLITLGGDTPFNITDINKPAWMTLTLTGSQISLTGTPDADGTAIGVDFNIKNCEDAQILPFADTIDIAPEEEPGTGEATLELGSCGGGSVTIKNEANEPFHLVAADCSGSIELPYGTYYLHSYIYTACGSGSEIIPALGTYFTIGLANPSQAITINCL